MNRFRLRRANRPAARPARATPRILGLELRAHAAVQVARRRRGTAHQHPVSRAAQLAGGLAALTIVGTLLLRLPISGAARSLHWDEALFTAVSALSTTGLSVITPGTDLSLFGQIVLLLLMQIGGVGFMVGAVVVFRLLGRRITLTERLTLRDSLGLVSADALLQLTRRVLIGVVVIEAVGALLLWLNWHTTFGDGRAVFLAIFHSVSAFCNASFDLFSGSPTASAGFPRDTFSLLTISMLVILGSLGIPVLADAVRWPKHRAVSLHTRITLITAGALLLLGTLALFAGESQPGVLFADLPWPRRLLVAFFHSATSRTSGFLLQSLDTMAPSSVLTLIALMFIGGSPASMGGGITTSTFAVLMLALWNYARGRTMITVSHRTIPVETVLKAFAILAAALLVNGIVTWLLLMTQHASLDEALFETVSAFATSGFTLGLTSKLDLFGRLLIALTMFWGRLGALTIVVALAQHRPPAAITYPEEQILLG